MPSRAEQPPSIWWWAFGYLAAYVPYAALTKVVTGGLVDTGGTRLGGVELLPVTVVATVLTAIAFLVATGWWRAAVKPGRRLPSPTPLTVISGVCASGIIATTTLAYTFDATIVFVMLLMRGGVLILAPLIDVLTGRRIRWYSGAALALSIASLGTSVIGSKDPRIPLLCAIDIALYLGFYFVRLQLMSRKAKSQDPRANLRYFVEEQLVSSPALLAFLVVCAAAGIGGFGESLRAGFTSFFERPGHVLALAVVIGVTSQGTGIFGGLILLDPRENTFSIPVNRASSVLAGVAASVLVHAGFGGKLPQASELAGAAIMMAAILVLSFGAAAERLRGPRPAFARRISIAAAAFAVAAIVLGVVVASRGARSTGATRDPFVLVLSPGHATPDAARRLGEALSSATGLAVEVRRAADGEEAIATAGTASVDAGLLPIFEYLLVRQEFGVEARLQVLREGGAHGYTGMLLARADGGIDALADLAGRRVAFVDRASTTGFLLPARLLAAAGVTVEPVFAGDHEAAVRALLDGGVAAAATYDRPPPPGLRRLATTGQVPNEPVFFHPRVPRATREKVAAALVALSSTDPGRALLAETGGVTGFAPIADADYAEVRDLLAATQHDLADVVPGAWRLLDRARAWPGNLGPH
jgi:ABC-type phosphate/phosphonate transport system substrate-binding protein